jgi:hypothetical protein
LGREEIDRETRRQGKKTNKRRKGKERETDKRYGEK